MDKPIVTQAGELLPCPFCGGEAKNARPLGTWTVRDGYGPNQHQFHCKDCGSSCGLPKDTEAEAIAAWNTRSTAETERLRAENKAQAERRRVLEEALEEMLAMREAHLAGNVHPKGERAIVTAARAALGGQS